MTDDLRRELQQLPPDMDVSPGFYDRVMHRAVHRRRVIRAGSTGIAAAVIGAAIAVAVGATGSSSTAQIIPVAPPATTIAPSTTVQETQASKPSATATPTPTTGTPSSDGSPSTEVAVPTLPPIESSPPETSPPSATPGPPSTDPTTTTSPSAPATTGPAGPAPVTTVAYPPLMYTDLPYPTVCTSGSFPDADQGATTTLCVPDGYLLTASTSCPAGSATIAGEGACFVGGARNVLLAPVPNAGLPPVRGAALEGPGCAAGYTRVGSTATTAGPLHCIPDAYLPRTGYSCPGGSQLATDPAPLCFTPDKRTVVAPTSS